MTGERGQWPELPPLPDVSFGPNREMAAEVWDALNAGVTIQELLARYGVSQDDIAAAEANGTLYLLAMERLLLPGEAAYTFREVAERTGVDQARLRSLWRNLGLPQPQGDERVFADHDLAMLEVVAGLFKSEVLDPELVEQMTRVLGSAMSKVAVAQVEAMGLADVATDPEVEESFVVGASASLPLMPRVLDYVWRRHLQVAVRGVMLRLSEGEPSATVVGFADLVGFTAMSQRLEPTDLAEVIGRFESLAYDVVGSGGGRVVKMIGDEVMFTHDDCRAGADIALDLAAAFRDDEELSDVRVGLAAGLSVVREGDLYGPVVNLASRLVGLAKPSSVVVADEVHEALADEAGFTWRDLHAKRIKDIGRLRVWELSREG